MKKHNEFLEFQDGEMAYFIVSFTDEKFKKNKAWIRYFVGSKREPDREASLFSQRILDELGYDLDSVSDPMTEREKAALGARAKSDGNSIRPLVGKYGFFLSGSVISTDLYGNLFL